jgi:hypothetical protein
MAAWQGLPAGSLGPRGGLMVRRAVNAFPRLVDAAENERMLV